MAVRASVKVAVVDINVGLWSWSGLLNGDTGAPISVINSSALMAQLTSGTLGVGGTCIWQGSLDSGNTWFTLSDQSGVAISMTALIATKMVLERPILIRPNVTVGDGTTNLVASLYSRIGGGGSGTGSGGATTYAALSDAVTAPIATTNTSVANALATKAPYNAPATLAVNTALTAALHGNRTVISTAASLVHTVNNDAAGGWATGDLLYGIPGASGGTSGSFSIAAGTAIFILPDGNVASSLSSLSAQAGVVSLEHTNVADTWRVTSAPRSDSASVLRYGYGLILPVSIGASTYSLTAPPNTSSMAVVDTSVASAAAVTDTPVATYGVIPRVRYTSAAVGARQAGAAHLGDVRGNAGGIFNGRFPIAMGGGFFDLNAVANSMFLMGWARGVVAAGSNASVAIQGVWLGADNTDTNMQIMCNGPSGTAFKQDLGASFPNVPNKFYIFFLDKNGAGTEFYAQVTNITDGVDSPIYTLNSTTAGSAARMPDVTLTNYQEQWIRGGTGAGALLVSLMDVGGATWGKRV